MIPLFVLLPPLILLLLVSRFDLLAASHHSLEVMPLFLLKVRGFPIGAQIEQLESVFHKLLFQVEVKLGVGGERRRLVYLDQPWLKV